MSRDDEDEVRGRVQGHRDGHGFVVRDDGGGSIFLPPEQMRSVLHGDTVRVRVVRLDRKGRPEGRIVDIVDRPKGPVIGRLLHESGVWLVAPEDRRFGRDVLIPASQVGDAQAGQVVCAELTDAPSLQAQPVGRVSEVLGDVDDPGMEIEIAVRKYGVPHRFPEQALEEAQKFPARLRATDLKGRVDLRDVALITIDGEDARDFDDAVYCEPLALQEGLQGGWRLIVAIADVSHYVTSGSALDTAAYERATSVYFPRRVIPMLPERLSNGLCSLNPQEDRLSLVCDMVIDAEGEVSAYQFYPAVMRSHARLSYDEVGAIFTSDRGADAQRHAQILGPLADLREVYRALLRRRRVRGAVDFETRETKIVCDDAGRILKIVARERHEAHRVIEEAMLAANVCAADFIRGSRHPSLYRIHEGPTPEKREALRAYLKALGLGLSLGEEPTPGQFQAVAEATRDRPDAAQIHQMLLRSMQQALYTPINVGHFGLAYDAYTHFTSPIRRYPDLLVHRVIKSLLSRRRYNLSLPAVVSLTAPRRAPPSAARASIEPVDSKDAAAWAAAGAHTSACERRADEASRDVEAWLKCRYMRERLGEEFAGTVSAVASFGLFVTLDELYVEGLVHITELGGEYFRFDELRQELRGDRSGLKYAVGTRLVVQVSRVDLDGRRIDFRLVKPSAAGGRGERALSAKVKPDAQEELRTVLAADREVRKGGRARKSASAHRAVKPAKPKSVKAAKTSKSTEPAAARPAGRKSASRKAGSSGKAATRKPVAR